MRKESTLSLLFAKRDKAALYRTKRRMMMAAKIFDFIMEKGLTQKKVAELMDKSESDISEWLSGKRNITIDNISDFERVLGIKLLNIESSQTRTINNKPIELKVSKCQKVIQYEGKKISNTNGVFYGDIVTGKFNYVA